jgi:NADPH-dependent dioxygenase
VRLVDAADGPATTSRALATHARTLETYDQMGVLDELLDRGRRVEHFTLHQNGRRLIRFDTDYTRLPTRFPFTLMIDQALAEGVLREAAARRGVEVEWGTRLVAFDQDARGVGAELRRADGGTETVIADWLVGCDGGHSTIRKSLGLPLVGDSAETWLIADAVVDCDLPQDSIHWVRTRLGTIMLVPFPEPGKWRLLDTADVSYPDDDAVARRFEHKIRLGTGRTAHVERPSWVSVFTIQQRMIPGMRVGRCFVAGDAAHVHSPASGQGLNTGVQDAFNLSWKLAAVARGEADDALLDTYGAERVPVGAELLRSTRFATVMVQMRSRVLASALRGMFTLVRLLSPVKSRIERKIMGGMSALGLTYPGGVTRACAVTERDLERSAGWREFVAALREPGWTLLVHAGSARSAGLVRALGAWPGTVRVRTVGAVPTDTAAPDPLPDPDGRLRADLGLREGGWVLVRPDGYRAASGADCTDGGPERALRAYGAKDTAAGDPATDVSAPAT